MNTLNTHTNNKLEVRVIADKGKDYKLMDMNLILLWRVTMIHLIKNNILSIHFSLFLNLENHSVLKISTFLIICQTFKPFKPFTILFVLTMKLNLVSILKL